MLFEEQILGSASEFAHQDISDADIARGVAHLDEDPADEGRWFSATGMFRCGSVTRWGTDGPRHTPLPQTHKHQILPTPLQPKSRASRSPLHGPLVRRVLPNLRLSPVPDGLRKKFPRGAKPTMKETVRELSENDIYSASIRFFAASTTTS